MHVTDPVSRNLLIKNIVMNDLELQNDMRMNYRSLSSLEKAYVRFINETDRKVDVIWINYGGMFTKHTLSRKGDFIDVNTYKTHPWFAVDSATQDRLHIDRMYVYHPKTTREHFAEKYPGRELPFNFEARVRVKITIPLYSLKRRALLEIRNHLQEPEQVDSLDLPRNLKDDLKRVIQSRNYALILED